MPTKGRAAHSILVTVAGLTVLIWVLAPVSGAHLNPVVSGAAAWFDRTAPDHHLSKRRRRKTVLFIAVSIYLYPRVLTDDGTTHS